MKKEEIKISVLQALLREGADPEAMTYRVQDLETGRRFFTDGIRRYGDRILGVTLDGSGWGWLTAGLVVEVKE